MLQKRQNHPDLPDISVSQQMQMISLRLITLFGIALVADGERLLHNPKALSVLTPYQDEQIVELRWRYRPLQDASIPEKDFDITKSLSENGVAHAVLFCECTERAFALEFFENIGFRVLTSAVFVFINFWCVGASW